jgi:transposase-like protein
LGAELNHHLGYAPGADNGPLLIEVPRDRAGSFEPLLVPKHVLRFTGFEDKIMAMNARGMTMREAAI